MGKQPQTETRIPHVDYDKTMLAFRHNCMLQIIASGVEDQQIHVLSPERHRHISRQRQLIQKRDVAAGEHGNVNITHGSGLFCACGAKEIGCHAIFAVESHHTQD